MFEMLIRFIDGCAIAIIAGKVAAKFKCPLFRFLIAGMLLRAPMR